MLKQEEAYQKLSEEIVGRLRSSVFVLPTEQEMCGRLGVSRQTLRRALGRLKEEHIITSRQGSGYVLTGLYPSRANQIAVLAESDEVYLYPGFLTRIRGFFDRHHYQVSVFLTGGDTQREREMLLRILEEPPRGLIACLRRSLLPSCNARLYEALAGAGTKIVFPFGRYPNVQTGRVSLADDAQGGQVLTEHLLRKGVTSIAMILIEGDARGQERYLGYCRALEAYHLPLRDAYIIRISPEDADRIRRDRTDAIIRGYLAGLPEDTGAVICQQDELAFTLVHALGKQGIRVPDMMRVAGFDDSHLRTAGSVILTTMRRVPSDDAQAACRAMMQLLSGGGEADRQEFREGSRERLREPDRWRLVRGGSA